MSAFGVLTLCNLCVICNLKQISFLYIQILHNDCSHIEDMHRGRRLRAEFGLVKASIKWASTQENLSLGFVNNKGADQPAQPRSLISTFVIGKYPI